MTDTGRALTIRLPEELHEELRERAEQEDRTIASLLRLAARRYLANTIPAASAPTFAHVAALEPSGRRA
jgi:predicted transcriptional regulator